MNSKKLGAWKRDKLQPGVHDDYDFKMLAPKLKTVESENVDLRVFLFTS